MKKVLKIDENGFFIEDVIIDDEDITPTNCIETECQEGFYRPKWNGFKWVEGLSQMEIDTIKASQPIDIKVQAIEEINSATTVAGLKSAMLKFIEAS